MVPVRLRDNELETGATRGSAFKGSPTVFVPRIDGTALDVLTVGSGKELETIS
jgi:hypothetical protein